MKQLLSESTRIENHYIDLKLLKRSSNRKEELIDLDNVLEEYRLANETIRKPKRLLIQGVAGSGKTTLAKKIVHRLVQENNAEGLDRVLWVSMHHLNEKPRHYSFTHLLCDEYFREIPDNQKLAQTLEREIQKNPTNTLFILDGLDKVAQQDLTECLKRLLNHPRVIITSRYHSPVPQQIDPVDLALETLGFLETGVTNYIDQNGCVPLKTACDIKAFIKHHEGVPSLVKIPLYLELLCSVWRDSKQADQTMPTMAVLWEAMITRLWCEHIARFQQPVDAIQFPNNSLKRIRRSSRLRQWVGIENDYLGFLALNGLHDNRTKFEPYYLDDITEQFQLVTGYSIPLTLENTLEQCALIQSSRQTPNDPTICQFVHSTLQDFLAAQWLVKCLKEKTPLGFMETPGMRTDEWIQRYKYYPRYRMIWIFMAGLLKGEFLDIFFERLDQGSEDLIGLQHQHLIMNCLNQSHHNLSKAKQEKIKASLYAWLNFERTQTNYEHESSKLGDQAVFPEELLLKQIQVEDQLPSSFLQRIKQLEHQYTLSTSTMRYLMTRLKDDNEWISHAVARVLAKQPYLSSEVVSYLSSLLKENASLGKAADIALSTQLNLYPEAIYHLIELLQDDKSSTRDLAASILSRQLSLSPEVMQRLITLCDTQGQYMKTVFCDVLHSLSNLPENIVERLMILSTDEDYWVRRSAIEILGHQSYLSPKIGQCLLSLCRTEHNFFVRNAVSRTLGKHLSSSKELEKKVIILCHFVNERVRHVAVFAIVEGSRICQETVDCLVNLCRDTSDEIRKEALMGLAKQSNLSSDAIKELITLSKEDNSVTSSVLAILGDQFCLSPEAIDCLIDVCKNESSYFIRAHACHALVSVPLSSAVLTCLIEAFQDANMAVKCSIATILVKHCHASPKAADCLIDLCRSQEIDVRDSVATYLSRQSNLPRHLIQQLIVLSKDKNDVIRHSVATALEKQTSLSLDAVQCLIDLCTDPVAYVKNKAAQAIIAQSSMSLHTVQWLVSLLKGEDSLIQATLARALSRQSDLPKEIVAHLITSSNDTSYLLRYAVATILSGQAYISSEIVECLIKLSKDVEHGTRVQVIATLAKVSLEFPDALHRLMHLAIDPHDSVRYQVAATFGQASSQNPDALKTLLTLSTDQNIVIRSKAVQSLSEQPIWRGYSLVSKMSADVEAIRQIYTLWLIPSNFKQLKPLYIGDDQLHFETPEGMQSIRLDMTRLKKNILAAQKSLGIPEASQVRDSSKGYPFFCESRSLAQSTTDDELTVSRIQYRSH